MFTGQNYLCTDFPVMTDNPPPPGEVTHVGGRPCNSAQPFLQETTRACNNPKVWMESPSHRIVCERDGGKTSSELSRTWGGFQTHPDWPKCPGAQLALCHKSRMFPSTTKKPCSTDRLSPVTVLENTKQNKTKKLQRFTEGPACICLANDFSFLSQSHRIHRKFLPQVSFQSLKAST